MLLLLISLEGCMYCRRAKEQLYELTGAHQSNDHIQRFRHGTLTCIVYHITRHDIARVHEKYGQHTFPMVMAKEVDELVYLGGSEVIDTIYKSVKK